MCISTYKKIGSQVTCGWSHTCALSSDGRVYTWGNGDHGKLVSRSSFMLWLQPCHLISGPRPPQIHTCIHRHSLHKPNPNTNEQGHGDTAKVLTPRVVEPLAHLHVTKVCVHFGHKIFPSRYMRAHARRQTTHGPPLSTHSLGNRWPPTTSTPSRSAPPTRPAARRSCQWSS